MKKRFIFLSVLFLTLACSKGSEDEGTGQRPESDPTPTVEYQYIIKAVADISGDGQIPFKWASKDKVSIYSVSGTLLQNVTISDGVGTDTGTFTFETSERIEDAVRLVYPYGKNGQGYLTSLQETDGNNPSDVHNHSFFYSQPLTLVEDQQVKCTLDSPLAYIRVDLACSGSDDVSFVGFRFSSAGAVLAGDYFVNYSDGAITAGEEVEDHVEVSFYNTAPVLSGETASFWAVALPSVQEKQYELVLTILSQEKTYEEVITVHSALPAGAVTVIDVTGTSLENAHDGNAGGFEDNVIEPLK